MIGSTNNTKHFQFFIYQKHLRKGHSITYKNIYRFSNFRYKCVVCLEIEMREIGYIDFVVTRATKRSGENVNQISVCRIGGKYDKITVN